VHSFIISGNGGKCPFCKAEVLNKTEEEANQELMQRVEANDANAMFVLANRYYDGLGGLQQNQAKAIELWKRASELGSSLAHFQLAVHYSEGGDLKKEKLHYEAAAMAGNEVARYNLGCKEEESGDRGRAVRHWTIAASAGNHNALYNLLVAFNQGSVSRNEINSTLTAYNNSCAEMRSEARDAFIHLSIDRIDAR
jgi:TPR repeat protein